MKIVTLRNCVWEMSVDYTEHRTRNILTGFLRRFLQSLQANLGWYLKRDNNRFLPHANQYFNTTLFLSHTSLNSELPSALLNND